MIVGVFHPPMRLESFGGSVAVTLSVVNALAENGYDVILFTRNLIDQHKLSEIMGEKLPDGVKIILKSSILRSRSIVNLYEIAFKLLALKLKCDLVVDTYSNYVFPWTDVSYVHFPYLGSPFFKRNFPYLNLAKKREVLSHVINWPYVFFERNFEKYDRKLLLANSQFTSGVIKKAMGVDAEVLYPPVSSLFLNALNVYGKKNRKNLVVTVGRITDYKRLETIPLIASMLRKNDVKFTIVGFLHDKDTLRKINAEIELLGLKDKVKVLTNISKEDLKKILGKAKVYLHPPTVEHFGISIAEAMAMGCIPVVYHVGGAKEYVPREFIYKDLYEAAEKVGKSIDTWSVKEAKKMNRIVQRFSDLNFRKNFIRIFADYCSQIDQLY